MILLQTQNVARRFGGDTLFEKIQMSVQEKSRIALVGRNGAGKSTLLKIIAGEEAPDEGTISQKKGLKLGYLAQNSGLHSQKSVWKEMLTAFSAVRETEKRMHQLEKQIATTDPKIVAYEELLTSYAQIQHQFEEQNGYGYEAEIRSILHGFQFDETYYDREVSTLSGGQKTRLALVKLLLEKPELLILDEPTNHLDIETLNWLENYLQNYRGTLLIVSHDRYFLDKVVTEVYELSRQHMTYYNGNYSRYLDQKAQKMEQEWKSYEKQQVEIAKLEDFVQRNIVRASTTKRAQSRRKQLEKLERIEKPLGQERSAKFLFEIKEDSGNVVLDVINGAIGYDKKVLCSPIDFNLRRQEAVALVGPNGIGKSTLLKSIIGELPFIHGEAQLGAHVSIGYYDQEQANLTSHKDVLHELWDEHPTTIEKDIRTVLGGFLFSKEDVNKTVPLLSGGEKARLALAKLAMNRENFLILDEPTNHLDIDSKEVLENALINYPGTLLFVSHDRYFINRIATKVLELSKDGSKLYLGNYDYYLEKKQEEAELAALAMEKQTAAKKIIDAPSTNQSNFKKNKEAQKQLRTLQRQVLKIEEDLAMLEETIADIHEQMTLPENLEDHIKLQELSEHLEKLETQQEQMLEQWEATSLEIEAMDT